MPISSVGLAAVMCRLSRTRRPVSSPRLRGCAHRRSEDVTERALVARGSGAFLAKSLLSLIREWDCELPAQLQGIRFRRRYDEDG